MSGSNSKRKRSKSPSKPLELETAKLGFIGSGKMTESLVNGFIDYGKVDKKRIFISAPTEKNSIRFKEKGCNITKRNYDIFGKFDCDVIFICCPGSVVLDCLRDPKRPHPLCTNFIPLTSKDKYIFSLVSGVKLTQLQTVLLNPDHKGKYIIEMHRIVINPACAYGLGICAIDVEPDSNKLSASLRTLLSTISKLEHVPEEQMDAACAICGAGLAFVYCFIKAMADGALKAGLDRSIAIKFAAKTLQCAAQSLLETGKHPGELRDHVCAPGGPAIEGINKMNNLDLNGSIISAVEKSKDFAFKLLTAKP
ncbi:pyrroline-5-carboxylate reductase 3-like [Tetranychus urticae]|uniref:Pyrroline-5-carboxylate reductase 3 n=1 Tax=Tetranychus urticae TaxID=32264 RepID=T1KEB3_TETUR|nr:pyrroline-5-carboxylate reductase 3-like [Tetranychus urticae]